MSKNLSGASNYAKILFEVAKEEEILSEVLYELKKIDSLKDRELNKIFTLPILTKMQKVEMIKELEQFQIMPQVLNLLKILAESDQLVLIPRIISEYSLLYQNEFDVQVVHATFAKEISNEQKDLVIARLEKQLNKFIVLLIEYDESLIAGVKLEYDSVVINNTVKNHLKKIYNAI